MENLDFYKELFENYLGVVIETERHKNKIYFTTSFMTFAKYFILFKHCSSVFPVAPTSIILAYFPEC